MGFAYLNNNRRICIDALPYSPKQKKRKKKKRKEKKLPLGVEGLAIESLAFFYYFIYLFICFYGC